MVINPQNSKPSHFSNTCFTSWEVSDGGTPFLSEFKKNDFRVKLWEGYGKILHFLLSSPLVFTCIITLSFWGFSSLIQDVFKASASFIESTVSTTYKLGTETTLFTLFLCKWPMKCHWMSWHSWIICQYVSSQSINSNQLSTKKILFTNRPLDPQTFQLILECSFHQNAFDLDYKLQQYH